MSPDPVDIFVRLVDADTNRPFREANVQSKESATKNLGGEKDDAVKQAASKTVQLLNDLKSLNTDKLSQTEKDKVALMQFASQGAQRIASGLKGIMTKSFEVVEMIYKKLLAASPLLQAIETLFNLAWTIFFMPIGNKIGELLIPAVINLMDIVMAFWDEIGDGGLDEMVSKAVEWGIRALSTFFKNIGSVLAEQTGWVGDIGRFLTKLGNFIENQGEKLLNFIFDWATWNVEHMDIIVSLIGTFMSLHYALQLATMATIAGSNSVLGWFGMGAAIAVGAGGAIGSMYLGSQFAMADGGYVPAKEGGSLHLLGEGGEGEYVIPETKNSAMGGNHYTINNYCYSTDELKRVIKDVLSEEVSLSRLKGGF